VIICFLDDSHLDWGEMDFFSNILICSFMAKNVEYFPMYLLVICISYFETNLFNSFINWTCVILLFNILINILSNE
jgi:hypothetical protein